MDKKELHEMEMELVELLDNNELTREHIIDKFTTLINEVR